MTDEVRRLLEKAGHALKVAEELMADHFPADASSKIYYCMFYAAQALLKSRGIDVVKHSAVEAAFGFHLAKRGVIDLKFHKILIEAREIREIADYDTEEEIVEPVATLKIEQGKEFLQTVKSILKLAA